MIEYSRSPSEVLRAIGRRARERRVARKLTQAALASRAGMGVATLIRFERAGTASLATALRIARALNAEGGFEKLFEAPPFASLDEALAEAPRARRRRGGG